MHSILFEILFEVISALDVIFDFLVLSSFSRNGDVAWFCLSLGCALAPYVIAYSSLNSYFVYRGVFKGSKTRNFLGLMFMFPISMVYFFVTEYLELSCTVVEVEENNSGTDGDASPQENISALTVTAILY